MFVVISVVPFWGAQLCERLPSPNGESVVDCNSLSSMPNVAFTIADKTFELTPDEVSDSSCFYNSSLPLCTSRSLSIGWMTFLWSLYLLS